MRLFFAVPIGEEVSAAVQEAVARIPLEHPPWRWIPPRNYHITLKFLGEVGEMRVPRLVDVASRAAGAARPFDLSFTRFGAFPSISRPRVLFYEAKQGAGELSLLAARLEEELATLGFERERRGFRAHLTLARVRRPLSPEVQRVLESVPDLPAPALQPVGRFVLVQSTLSSSGARYEELDSFPLGG